MQININSAMSYKSRPFLNPFLATTDLELVGCGVSDNPPPTSDFKVVRTLGVHHHTQL